jgi:hypothetical protein
LRSRRAGGVAAHLCGKRNNEQRETANVQAANLKVYYQYL